MATTPTNSAIGFRSEGAHHVCNRDCARPQGQRLGVGALVEQQDVARGGHRLLDELQQLVAVLLERARHHQQLSGLREQVEEERRILAALDPLVEDGVGFGDRFSGARLATFCG